MEDGRTFAFKCRTCGTFFWTQVLLNLTTTTIDFFLNTHKLNPPNLFDITLPHGLEKRSVDSPLVNSWYSLRLLCIIVPGLANHTTFNVAFVPTSSNLTSTQLNTKSHFTTYYATDSNLPLLPLLLLNPLSLKLTKPPFNQSPPPLPPHLLSDHLTTNSMDLPCHEDTREKAWDE